MTMLFNWAGRPNLGDTLLVCQIHTSPLWASNLSFVSCIMLSL